ncbi:MAG: toluene tolerance protein [bacterium]|nr:toluene tolerance protein [bacterium]
MNNGQLRELEPEEFEVMIRDARVLSEDGRGIKVLETTGGEIIKFFRRRHRLSTAVFYPYSKRFIRNASILKQRGIETVNVVATYAKRKSSTDAVVYRKTRGRALRNFLESAGIPSEATEQTLGDFTVFFARLHREGILFRSIHFANVLVLDHGGFAIIDVADISYSRRGPLTPGQRVRNFIHMSRYEEDRKALAGFGMSRFLELYLESAQLSPRQQQRFSRLLSIKMRKTYPGFP